MASNGQEIQIGFSTLLYNIAVNLQKVQQVIELEKQMYEQIQFKIENLSDTLKHQANSELLRLRRPNINNLNVSSLQQKQNTLLQILACIKKLHMTSESIPNQQIEQELQHLRFVMQYILFEKPIQLTCLKFHNDMPMVDCKKMIFLSNRNQFTVFMKYTEYSVEIYEYLDELNEHRLILTHMMDQKYKFIGFIGTIDGMLYILCRHSVLVVYQYDLQHDIGKEVCHGWTKTDNLSEYITNSSIHGNGFYFTVCSTKVYDAMIYDFKECYKFERCTLIRFDYIDSFGNIVETTSIGDQRYGIFAGYTDVDFCGKVIDKFIISFCDPNSQIYSAQKIIPTDSRSRLHADDVIVVSDNHEHLFLQLCRQFHRWNCRTGEHKILQNVKHTILRATYFSGKLYAATLNGLMEYNVSTNEWNESKIVLQSAIINHIHFAQLSL